jgi:hypothetical protein
LLTCRTSAEPCFPLFQPANDVLAARQYHAADSNQVHVAVSFPYDSESVLPNFPIGEWVCMVRVADAPDNDPDVDVAMVDVPAFLTAAGEGGMCP